MVEEASAETQRSNMATASVSGQTSKERCDDDEDDMQASNAYTDACTLNTNVHGRCYRHTTHAVHPPSIDSRSVHPHSSPSLPHV